MKTKRKWLALAMAVLCIVYMAGCEKGSETGGTNATATLQGTLGGAEESKPTETVPQESGNPDKKNTEDQKNPITGLPEGYVYDYQVSLEPIPQEIADLGGTCVGTMHAFPSRIMVGLMKQRMEEDPEFKKEAEQKTEEVRKALEEEIGGEFEVEPMEVDNIGWDFSCRERETDYQFEVSYTAQINISEYYREINAKKYEEDMSGIISEVYDSNCQRFWFIEQLNLLYIFIADFGEEDINYREEQSKILELWKKLREYDEGMHYIIRLEFYSTEYEGIVYKRYKEGTFTDLNWASDESKKALKMKGEIKDIFIYNDVFGGKEGMLNLDNLLEEYKNGTYDETQKWENWIEGGEY